MSRIASCGDPSGSRSGSTVRRYHRALTAMDLLSCGLQRPARSIRSRDDVEDERELGAVLARPQFHAAARAAIAARAAGDGQRAVLGVIERALDGDLAVREQRRPVALVRAPGDRPDAVALV